MLPSIQPISPFSGRWQGPTISRGKIFELFTPMTCLVAEEVYFFQWGRRWKANQSVLGNKWVAIKAREAQECGRVCVDVEHQNWSSPTNAPNTRLEWSTTTRQKCLFIALQNMANLHVGQSIYCNTCLFTNSTLKHNKTYLFFTYGSFNITIKSLQLMPKHALIN